MRNMLYNLTARNGFLLLLALSLSLLLLWLIKGFLIALVLAAVLAALTHPTYRWLLDKTAGRKNLAAGMTVLGSLLLVIVPMLLFITVLTAEAIVITQQIQDWVAEHGTLRAQIMADPKFESILPYQNEIATKAGQFAENAASWLINGLAAGAKGTAIFFLRLFVLLFAMFFFLTDGASFFASVFRYTPLSEADKEHLLRIFGSVSRATLRGTLIIGIVQGGLAALSFWVADISGVIFWFAIMTVLSIIPGIGTALVWVPAVGYLAVTGEPVAALGVGLWCAVIVGTVDNVLRPRVIGRDAQMHDLLILLTTLGGLAVFGPAGLILGPIIGALCRTVWVLWASSSRRPPVRQNWHRPEGTNHVGHSKS